MKGNIIAFIRKKCPVVSKTKIDFGIDGDVSGLRIPPKQRLDYLYGSYKLDAGVADGYYSVKLRIIK